MTLARPAAQPLSCQQSPTFDIHIHFSETSRETFTDKVVRLIENDMDSVTD